MVSLHTQIVDAMVSKLEALTVGEPLTDPYTIAYSQVFRDPLSDNLPRGRRAVAAVYATSPQHTSYTNGQSNGQMNVSIDVLLSRKSSELGPSVLVETSIAELERALKEDVTLGGLTYQILVDSSSIDVEGITDTQIGGKLNLQVYFKRSTTDPRSSG